MTRRGSKAREFLSERVHHANDTFLLQGTKLTNMDEDLRLAQVVMVRPTLDGFPEYELPRPFTIRWYQAGDEQHWLAMKARSDSFHHADSAYYQQTYGAHAGLLPQRQAFLCDPGGQ